VFRDWRPRVAYRCREGGVLGCSGAATRMVGRPSPICFRPDYAVVAAETSFARLRQRGCRLSSFPLSATWTECAPRGSRRPALANCPLPPATLEGPRSDLCRAPGHSHCPCSASACSTRSWTVAPRRHHPSRLPFCHDGYQPPPVSYLGHHSRCHLPAITPELQVDAAMPVPTADLSRSATSTLTDCSVYGLGHRSLCLSSSSSIPPHPIMAAPGPTDQHHPRLFDRFVEMGRPVHGCSFRS